MILYLGTHRPTWLTMPGPRLMVSLNTLPVQKAYRAAVDWFCDSGGFSELQLHGRWRTTAAEHADRCLDVVERFGRVVHVSPQDWMCEPPMIHGAAGFVGTGLSVREHQERTVQNFLDLTALAPSVPWVPVLQGWEVDDYHRCADLYASAGVELAAQPLVGVGSVCRRQAMDEAVDIIRTLSERELTLHGFGFKQEGIAKCWPYFGDEGSVDSMAWSLLARLLALRTGKSCGRANGRGGIVKSCGNCRHEAIDWHDRTLAKIGAPIAQRLPFFEAGRITADRAVA